MQRSKTPSTLSPRSLSPTPSEATGAATTTPSSRPPHLPMPLEKRTAEVKKTAEHTKTLIAKATDIARAATPVTTKRSDEDEQAFRDRFYVIKTPDLLVSSSSPNPTANTSSDSASGNTAQSIKMVEMSEEGVIEALLAAKAAIARKKSDERERQAGGKPVVLSSAVAADGTNAGGMSYSGVVGVLGLDGNTFSIDPAAAVVASNTHRSGGDGNSAFFADEVADAQRELDQEKKRNQALLSFRKPLSLTEMRAKAEELKTLKDRLEKSKSEKQHAAALKHELTSAEEKVDSLIEKLGSITEALDDCREEVDDFQTRLEDAERERQQASEQLPKYRKRAEDLEREEEGVREALEAAQKEYERKKAVIDEAEARLHALMRGKKLKKYTYKKKGHRQHEQEEAGDLVYEEDLSHGSSEGEGHEDGDGEDEDGNETEGSVAASEYLWGGESSRRTSVAAEEQGRGSIRGRRKSSMTSSSLAGGSTSKQVLSFRRTSLHAMEDKRRQILARQASLLLSSPPPSSATTAKSPKRSSSVSGVISRNEIGEEEEQNEVSDDRGEESQLPPRRKTVIFAQPQATKKKSSSSSAPRDKDEDGEHSTIMIGGTRTSIHHPANKWSFSGGFLDNAADYENLAQTEASFQRAEETAAQTAKEKEEEVVRAAEEENHRQQRSMRKFLGIGESVAAVSPSSASDPTKGREALFSSSASLLSSTQNPASLTTTNFTMFHPENTSFQREVGEGNGRRGERLSHEIKTDKDDPSSPSLHLPSVLGGLGVGVVGVGSNPSSPSISAAALPGGAGSQNNSPHGAYTALSPPAASLRRQNTLSSSSASGVAAVYTAFRGQAAANAAALVTFTIDGVANISSGVAQHTLDKQSAKIKQLSNEVERRKQLALANEQQLFALRDRFDHLRIELMALRRYVSDNEWEAVRDLKAQIKFYQNERVALYTKLYGHLNDFVLPSVKPIYEGLDNTGPSAAGTPTGLTSIATRRQTQTSTNNTNSNALEEIKKQMEKQIAVANAEGGHLHTQRVNDKLRAEISSWKVKCENKNTALAAMRERLELVEKEAMFGHDLVLRGTAELNRRLELLFHEASIAEKRSVEREAELHEAYGSQIKDLEKHIATLEDDLQSATERMEYARDEHYGTSRKFTGLQAEITALKEENARLAAAVPEDLLSPLTTTQARINDAPIYSARLSPRDEWHERPYADDDDGSSSTAAALLARRAIAMIKPDLSGLSTIESTAEKLLLLRRRTPRERETPRLSAGATPPPSSKQSPPLSSTPQSATKVVQSALASAWEPFLTSSLFNEDVQRDITNIAGSLKILASEHVRDSAAAQRLLQMLGHSLQRIAEWWRSNGENLAESVNTFSDKLREVLLPLKRQTEAEAMTDLPMSKISALLQKEQQLMGADSSVGFGSPSAAKRASLLLSASGGRGGGGDSGGFNQRRASRNKPNQIEWGDGDDNNNEYDNDNNSFSSALSRAGEDKEVSAGRSYVGFMAVDKTTQSNFVRTRDASDNTDIALGNAQSLDRAAEALGVGHRERNEKLEEILRLKITNQSLADKDLKEREEKLLRRGAIFEHNRRLLRRSTEAVERRRMEVEDQAATLNAKQKRFGDWYARYSSRVDTGTWIPNDLIQVRSVASQCNIITQATVAPLPPSAALAMASLVNKNGSSSRLPSPAPTPRGGTTTSRSHHSRPNHGDGDHAEGALDTSFTDQQSTPSGNTTARKVSRRTLSSSSAALSAAASMPSFSKRPSSKKKKDEAEAETKLISKRSLVQLGSANSNSKNPPVAPLPPMMCDDSEVQTDAPSVVSTGTDNPNFDLLSPLLSLASNLEQSKKANHHSPAVAFVVESEVGEDGPLPKRTAAKGGAPVIVGQSEFLMLYAELEEAHARLGLLFDFMLAPAGGDGSAHPSSPLFSSFSSLSSSLSWADLLRDSFHHMRSLFASAQSRAARQIRDQLSDGISSTSNEEGTVGRGRGRFSVAIESVQRDLDFGQKRFQSEEVQKKEEGVLLLPIPFSTSSPKPSSTSSIKTSTTIDKEGKDKNKPHDDADRLSSDARRQYEAQIADLLHRLRTALSHGGKAPQTTATPSATSQQSGEQNDYKNKKDNGEGKEEERAERLKSAIARAEQAEKALAEAEHNISASQREVDRLNDLLRQIEALQQRSAKNASDTLDAVARLLADNNDSKNNKRVGSSSKNGDNLTNSPQQDEEIAKKEEGKKKKKEEMAEAMEALTKENKRLRSELDRLRMGGYVGAEETAKLTQSLAANELLTREINSLKKAAASFESEKNALEAEVSSLLVNLNGAEATFEGLKREREVLREKNEELMTSLTRLKKQLEEALRTKESLRRDVLALSSVVLLKEDFDVSVGLGIASSSPSDGRQQSALPFNQSAVGIPFGRRPSDQRPTEKIEKGGNTAVESSNTVASSPSPLSTSDAVLLKAAVTHSPKSSIKRSTYNASSSSGLLSGQKHPEVYYAANSSAFVLAPTTASSSSPRRAGVKGGDNSTLSRGGRSEAGPPSLAASVDAVKAEVERFAAQLKLVALHDSIMTLLALVKDQLALPILGPEEADAALYGQVRRFFNKQNIAMIAAEGRMVAKTVVWKHTNNNNNIDKTTISTGEELLTEGETVEKEIADETHNIITVSNGGERGDEKGASLLTLPQPSSASTPHQFSQQRPFTVTLDEFKGLLGALLAAADDDHTHIARFITAMRKRSAARHFSSSSPSSSPRRTAAMSGGATTVFAAMASTAAAVGGGGKMFANEPFNKENNNNNSVDNTTTTSGGSLAVHVPLSLSSPSPRSQTVVSDDTVAPLLAHSHSFSSQRSKPPRPTSSSVALSVEEEKRTSTKEKTATVTTTTTTRREAPTSSALPRTLLGGGEETHFKSSNNNNHHVVLSLSSATTGPSVLQAQAQAAFIRLPNGSLTLAPTTSATGAPVHVTTSGKQLGSRANNEKEVNEENRIASLPAAASTITTMIRQNSSGKNTISEKSSFTANSTTTMRIARVSSVSAIEDYEDIRLADEGEDDIHVGYGYPNDEGITGGNEIKPQHGKHAHHHSAAMPVDYEPRPRPFSGAARTGSGGHHRPLLAPISSADKINHQTRRHQQPLPNAASSSSVNNDKNTVEEEVDMPTTSAPSTTIDAALLQGSASVSIPERKGGAKVSAMALANLLAPSHQNNNDDDGKKKRNHSTTKQKREEEPPSHFTTKSAMISDVYLSVMARRRASSVQQQGTAVAATTTTASTNNTRRPLLPALVHSTPADNYMYDAAVRETGNDTQSNNTTLFDGGSGSKKGKGSSSGAIIVGGMRIPSLNVSSNLFSLSGTVGTNRSRIYNAATHTNTTTVTTAGTGTGTATVTRTSTPTPTTVLVQQGTNNNNNNNKDLSAVDPSAPSTPAVAMAKGEEHHTERTTNSGVHNPKQHHPQRTVDLVMRGLSATSRPVLTTEEAGGSLARKEPEGSNSTKGRAQSSGGVGMHVGGGIFSRSPSPNVVHSGLPPRVGTSHGPLAQKKQEYLYSRRQQQQRNM